MFILNLMILQLISSVFLIGCSVNKSERNLSPTSPVMQSDVQRSELEKNSELLYTLRISANLAIKVDIRDSNGLWLVFEGLSLDWAPLKVVNTKVHTCGLEIASESANISVTIKLPIPNLNAPCQLSPGSVIIKENGVTNSYSLDSIDGRGKSEQDLRSRLNASLSSKQNKKLTVDFQSGFKGEKVEVWIAGKPIYEDVVRENPIDGLADTLSAKFTDGDVLTLNLPDQKITKNLTLNSKKGNVVGIALLNNEIIIKQQIEPFGYD